jgi:hypothetical protein
MYFLLYTAVLPMNYITFLNTFADIRVFHVLKITGVTLTQKPNLCSKMKENHSFGHCYFMDQENKKKPRTFCGIQYFLFRHTKLYILI